MAAFKQLITLFGKLRAQPQVSTSFQGKELEIER